MSPEIHLSATVSDGVAWLELTRPAARNALTLATVRALRSAVRRAGEDRDVDVVVLTGAGPAFCAGLDLREQAGLAESEFRELVELMYVGIPTAMATTAKPVVAAVNGPARGAGCTLAFASDLVVAAATADFGLPEISAGLLPGYHLVHLSEALGPARTFEFAFGQAPVPAPRAAALGLVNRVVEDAGWLAGVAAFVDQYRGLPADAVTVGKRLLRDPGLVSARGARAVEAVVALRAGARGSASGPQSGDA